MEDSQRAKTELNDDLKPKLKSEKEKMDEIAMKNKNTKQFLGFRKYLLYWNQQ